MSLHIEDRTVFVKSPEDPDRVVFSFEDLAKLLFRLPMHVSKYDVKNEAEFGKMSPDEQAVIYSYFSTMSTYLRALVYEGMNPYAKEDESSGNYLRSNVAQEQKRLFTEIESLLKEMRPRS